MNSPQKIAENYIATGASKLRMPWTRTIVLSILAGVFIALAGVGATITSAVIPNASLGKLIAGCVFPSGLAMCVIAGAELFTGNTLVIVPVLERQEKLRQLVRNWVLVYIGNFIGSIIITALVVYGGTLDMFADGALGAAVIKTANAKVHLSFFAGTARGILCNILVCIAVWMTFAANDIGGKVLALFFPILIFVAAGYEHSVANMFYVPAGLFAKGFPQYLEAFGGDVSGLTWGAFFVKNLIPVTLGNIIGGSGFVGAMYWLAYLKKPHGTAA
ncbi:MAG: formate/nitrite transporter family protein [Oscillospiraceae bacterium]|nr:formate/nitrite transporter family protein [Oscillospiraceae bacterium]